MAETSEQRFTKIENALKHSSELHAQHIEAIRRHDEEMRELRQMHKSLIIAVGKIGEAQQQTEKTLNDFIQWVKRNLQRPGPNGQDTPQ